ncbi:MAG: hypothetical protein ACRDTQ_04535, partial [Micromonosporaceae bacterium]
WDDGSPPAYVADRLLWREAQRILERHQAERRGAPCQACGAAYPCEPQSLAQRALEAACEQEGVLGLHVSSGEQLLPALLVQPARRFRHSKPSPRPRRSAHSARSPTATHGARPPHR